MDKLKYMKTFMTILEEGSIINAAKKLGITKAAVSKQLIDLEASLKTQLFHRTTRTLTVTDTGRLYYASLRNIFAAIAEADSIVDHLHKKPTGLLRIAAHRYFGEKYIVSNMHDFIQQYPDLKLDFEFADRFPDLEKENIDILCGIGHEGPEHLVRKKIASFQPILCASPNYLKQYGIPQLPEELKQHQYITHSFREPDNVLRFSQDKELFLDCHIRINDAQSMMQCALCDLGIIKIYNYFVEEHIQSGRLIEILKDYREPAKPMYLFYQQQKIIQPKIRVFIDFICKKINQITFIHH
jgi:DNA-binding transcriptional LysR family regulator